MTQDIADSIRQGDYDAAGDAIADLGDNNDQLSREAKQALADSLGAAADNSAATPELQDAERKAAEALRNGTYGEIKKALDRIEPGCEKHRGRCNPPARPRQEFPYSICHRCRGRSYSSCFTEWGSAAGQDQQSGDSGEQGQQGQPNSGGISQPDASGQQAQPGDSANGAPNNTPGNEPGPPSGQGQGSGAGDAGLPGEGSRVDGPGSQALDPAGDPFALEGNEVPDPNNLRPGDGSEPPAMTLEGDAGSSGGATGPVPGRPHRRYRRNRRPADRQVGDTAEVL